MPTDRELAEQAWEELTKTTYCYSSWDKQGFPEDHWQNAKELLDQIDVSPPEPSNCYWGARMDGATYGGGAGDAPWDANTWNTFESHAGKKVAVVEWGQPFATFDTNAATKTRDRGAFSELTMASVGSSTLAKIGNGEQDAAIDAFADKVKSFGYPILFRPWHEMNGSWAHDWFGSYTPAEYVKAWKRFRDRCNARGATNLTWCWCVNIWNGETSGSVSDPRPYYPGDGYVDWFGVDGYNFATSTVGQVFDYTLNLLKGIADKPVAITETASVENSKKPQWTKDLLSTYLPAHPQVKSVAWFNWPIQEAGTTRSWPIESSSAAQQAFHDAIQNSRYLAAPATPWAKLTKIPLP